MKKPTFALRDLVISAPIMTEVDDSENLHAVLNGSGNMHNVSSDNEGSHDVSDDGEHSDNMSNDSGGSQDERVKRSRIIIRKLRPKMNLPHPRRDPVDQIHEHLRNEQTHESIAPHTCGHCDRLVFDMRRHGQSHDLDLGPSELKSARDHGCALLQWVLSDDTETTGRRSSDHPTRRKWLASPTLTYSHDQSLELHIQQYLPVFVNKTYELFTKPGETPETPMLDTLLPPNLVPNSDLSFTRARNWLNKCDSTHTECHAFRESFMPHRLIDVGTDAANPTIRLITTSELSPYATLSYCWGGDQPTKTTRANVGQYEARIQTALLPQTILDALTVTRGIGLRYLWIDAYCIVQDDEDDKTRQISQMHQVYRGSYVTIIAAKADSSNSGFLAPREAYRPVKMNVRWDDNVFEEAIAVRQSDESQDHRLFTRGWTLQEVRLSARVLMYGHSDAGFACVKGIRSDSGRNSSRHRRMRNILAPGNDTVSSSTNPHPSEWFYVVSEYTRRDLSVDSDKLLAIAGLAEEYANTRPVTDYLAGMWREDLLHQLLWNPRPFKRKERKATRPAEYRAPSWSWASLDGEIWRNDIDNFTENGFTESTCELVDAHVELRIPEHRFGQVLGGVLQLHGNLKRFTWTDSSDYAYENSKAISPHDRRATVQPDIRAEWPLDSEVSFWALEIFRKPDLREWSVEEDAWVRDGRYYFSQALVLDANGDGTYRRVGTLYVIPQDPLPAWFDNRSSFEKVTII